MSVLLNPTRWFCAPGTKARTTSSLSSRVLAVTLRRPNVSRTLPAGRPKSWRHATFAAAEGADSAATKGTFTGVNSIQKQKLRAHAQQLGKKLVLFQVGKAGVTSALVEAIGDALTKNELIKVKVMGGCPDDLDEVCEQLEAQAKADLVGKIGATFLLYRPREEKSKLRPIVNSA
ncbi:hypothetical protein CYMTET_31774 [Cymbomonas tetramitiformis]|uniref:CRM domain-containing protein n=1 Tax=Cymbomonas tetramitiformis TaxID=36881 RepID=A0AAE0FGS7_9CHLO|nr:hypothetical protein CYMTET_31774 [Cymbomonas tetramitiformis]